MSIDLNREYTQFLDALVATGRFASKEDAVHEGLRLLKSREELRREVQLGIAQLNESKMVDGEEAFARLLEEDNHSDAR